jgi:hypothetical protein
MGITGNLLIGPHCCLKFKVSYLHILTEELPQLLEDVPLEIQQLNGLCMMEFLIILPATSSSFWTLYYTY